MGMGGYEKIHKEVGGHECSSNVLWKHTEGLALRWQTLGT